MYVHTKSVGGRTLWDQMDYSNGDKIEVQSTAHIRNKYNGIKSLPNLQYNYYAILCNIFFANIYQGIRALRTPYGICILTVL